MIYIVILLGLLFIGTGFLVTEKNASTWLAGYNTMSESERKKHDISTYIPQFRRFHIQLGVTFIIGGLIIYAMMSPTILGLFMAFYPILAYLYFFYISRHTLPVNNSKNGWKWGIGIMLLVLVGLTGLFTVGLSEDKLSIQEQSIHIGGSYSETIPKTDIQSLELVENRPKIKLKINGFSLGERHKGYYKTQEGDRVKLIINAKNPPYIKITKKDGSEIYYAQEEGDNSALYQHIKMALEL